MTIEPPTKQRRLTQKEWAEVCDHYELGIENGRQLARRFGVSPQAISAGLRRRGASKGRRVHELRPALELELALNDVRRFRAAQPLWDAAERRDAVIGAMMEALFREIAPEMLSLSPSPSGAD